MGCDCLCFSKWFWNFILWWSDECVRFKNNGIDFSFVKKVKLRIEFDDCFNYLWNVSG